MKPLYIDKSPFPSPPSIKEEIQWVRPKLICEIEYAELTTDEQLRQTLCWSCINLLMGEKTFSPSSAKAVSPSSFSYDEPRFV
jgi:bifunctional non-homologous end joining protein LigD